MSGVLLSCCNTGRGGPLLLAYCDDRTSEISWIRLDDIGIDLSRATGATGLFSGPDSHFVAIQGVHDPALILEFDHDLRIRNLIQLPGARDLHSIKVYDGQLYATSTGTNELFEINLDNSGKIACRFRCPTTKLIPNVHLNDYLRHAGKEYVLGHSNPFRAAGRRSGFVYCLTDREVVIDRLEHPHTLLVLDRRLAILDSARAMVVFVDDGVSKPFMRVDTGGILRGACQTDDALLLAMSSRRLFSRKRGLLQVNVTDDQVILGNESFMSWLYRFDKANLESHTRISLSEISFEIYDLAKLDHPPAPDRLIADAAALRSQAWRQQYFQLSQRHAGLKDLEDENPGPSAARIPAPVQSHNPAPAPSRKASGVPLWVLPLGGGDGFPMQSDSPTAETGTASTFATAKPQQTDDNFHIASANGSPKTIIAFAGLAQLIGGMTPYNFMNSLKGIIANVIFVRDPKRTWFNGPIEGVGKNSIEIGQKLNKLASELATQQLYLLGTSSGGFAALAYAKTLNAKRVMAFSPQTNIDLDYLDSVGETRWIKLITRIKNPSLVDTTPLLADLSGRDCHLIVGKRAKLDVTYAERLRSVPDVSIHYVDSGHNPAVFLWNSGLLSGILRQFVMDAPLTIGNQ